MHDDLIARIDKVRRKQARITKHIHAQSAVLVALDDELCELLTEAAQLACDAGHVSGGVAAAVVAPK
mgnify:FL=1